MLIMKRKSIFLMCLILAVMLVQSCASITRGSTESFVIKTKPPGATAKLSNGLSCDTPCSLKLKRRGDFLVTLSRDGYEKVTATVTSSVDGAGSAGMAGNILLGGIIGMGVDAGTGAMHSHQPNPLEVEMVPLKQGSKLPISVETKSLKSNQSKDPFDVILD